MMMIDSNEHDTLIKGSLSELLWTKSSKAEDINYDSNSKKDIEGYNEANKIYREGKKGKDIMLCSVPRTVPFSTTK